MKGKTMLRKNLPVGWLLAAVMLAAPAFGAEAEKAGLDPDAKKAALKAIDDGVQWLKSCQKEDGTWSLKQYPAITALAARAILQDPSRPAGPMDASAARGLAYVASCARPEGGIYLWAPVPEGHTSGSFADLVLDQADVIVSPGAAYGPSGEGYVRFSLTVPDDRLREAVERIERRVRL